MRWIVFIFCLLIAGTSYAQNCVVEGAWMGVGPGSLSRCCDGLELMPPPPGQIGSRGQCLKKENGSFCLGEKLNGFYFPGAVDKCCQGLSKVAPTDSRALFSCQKLPSCVAENEHISQNPAYSRPCCEGLRPVVINDGRIGAGPKCVKAPACVKENEYINMQSGAGCCEGLVPYMDDPRRMGGAQCVKKPETNCLQEGSPMFVYPGAPSCCRGLSPGRASPNSPVGFADVCLRGNQSPKINQSEINKDMFDHGVKLYDDPGVSNQ